MSGTRLQLLLVLLAAGTARAECLIDAYANDIPPFSSTLTVFPNWTTAPLASFILWECDDVTCPSVPSSLKGLTILNYGNATGGAGGDITSLAFQVVCGGMNSGSVPLSYAGPWGASHAWTWAGTIPFTTDPCGGCGCLPTLSVYGDINGCPTDGATVNLGLPLGGLTDDVTCAAPSGPVTAAGKTRRTPREARAPLGPPARAASARPAPARATTACTSS